MKKKQILENMLHIDEQSERINHLIMDLQSIYTTEVSATFELESTEYDLKYNRQSIDFDKKSLIAFLNSELERLQNEHDKFMKMLISK